MSRAENGIDCWMSRLVTDDTEAEAHSRLVILRLATLILRMRSGWTNDTAAIALAIASIHADKLLRDERLPHETRNLANALPEELYGNCNIASIAVAVGLNRETTRRKIIRLEEAGIVIRNGVNVRLASSLTQRGDLIRLVRDQLEVVRKTVDELIRDGVIKNEQ